MDALAWLETWKTLKWYYDFGIRCFGMISAWFLYGFRMTSRWLLYDFWMTSGWLLDDFLMTSGWLLDIFTSSGWLPTGEAVANLTTCVVFLFFFGWLREWENTVRRICEYCVFHITNAEKVFQITSRRRVIWKAFFGMSDVENSIITFPTSQYSHCWKIQPGN